MKSQIQEVPIQGFRWVGSQFRIQEWWRRGNQVRTFPWFLGRLESWTQILFMKFRESVFRILDFGWPRNIQRKFCLEVSHFPSPEVVQCFHSSLKKLKSLLKIVTILVRLTNSRICKHDFRHWTDGADDERIWREGFCCAFVFSSKKWLGVTFCFKKLFFRNRISQQGHCRHSRSDPWSSQGIGKSSNLGCKLQKLMETG